MKADYYKLLDVEPTAETQTVRKAYLLKARAWHPDNYGDDPPSDAQKQMQQLNEAWQCLQDDTTRAAYDQQRASAIQKQKIIKVAGNFSTINNVEKLQQHQEEVATQKQKRSFRKLLITFAVTAATVLIAFSFLTPTAVEKEPISLPADINLGAGITIGDCVSVQTGPSLLEVPCDANATGRVSSAEDACSPTAQELVLQNDVTVCLIAV